MNCGAKSRGQYPSCDRGTPCRRLRSQKLSQCLALATPLPRLQRRPETSNSPLYLRPDLNKNISLVWKPTHEMVMNKHGTKISGPNTIATVEKFATNGLPACVSARKGINELRKEQIPSLDTLLCPVRRVCLVHRNLRSQGKGCTTCVGPSAHTIIKGSKEW